MATIRKLRDKWQAMVRRKGIVPRSKSFDKKSDAEKWARDLETQVDVSGYVADTRIAEQTTLGDILTRYKAEITPLTSPSGTRRGPIPWPSSLVLHSIYWLSDGNPISRYRIK